MKMITRLTLSVTFFFAATEAMAWTPPPDSGWINVKTDLGAKGDGVTDDTAVFANFKPANIHSSGTFYFPNGTYLLSDTLYLGNKRVVFHGESEEGVIIRLKPNSPGFGDVEKPKPFISTHHQFMDQKSAMGQAFKNSLHNLTIEVGANNPGAVALHYLNNNQGTVENVTIRSLDPKGAGKAGLGLVTNWPGPALIRNLKVHGFDFGIWSLITQYSITLDQILLENQRVAGIRNKSQALFIRGLVSKNKVPAIVNTDPTTNIVLVDSQLTGGDPKANAVESWQVEPNKRWKEGAMTPGLFARNVKIEGYGRGIVSRGGGEELVANGPLVKEFVSRPAQTLGSMATTSLNIPWEAPPTMDLGDPSTWTNIRKFEPEKDGDDKENWGPAIQAAIDSGADVIYFPMGDYRVVSTIEVRGKVRAFMGMESTLSTNDWPDEQAPLFRIGPQAGPVILFERINDNYGKAPFRFEHAIANTIIIKNGLIGGYRNTVKGGKVHLLDVCGTRWLFEGQQVWAMQLNSEWNPGKSPKAFNIRVNGGRFVALGVKTEYGGTVIEAVNGAEVEILGGWSYHDGKTVGYINNNSKMSLAGILTSNGSFQEALIREIRGGQTRDLRLEAGSNQQNLDGSFRKYGTLLPLYLGN
jgi:hypothetical protein